MAEHIKIMLIAPCQPAARDPLKKAVAGHDIAAVLIAPPHRTSPSTSPEAEDTDAAAATHEPTLDAETCRQLIDAARTSSTVVLIADDPELADRLGADGCHLGTAADIGERYERARAVMGPNRVVGVTPGPTRHAAMTLAEAGADYVAYPATGADAAEGLERIAWWSEIFEAPVIAVTDGTVAALETAATAGPPDFIAVPLLSASAHPVDLAALTAWIAEHGRLPEA